MCHQGSLLYFAIHPSISTHVHATFRFLFPPPLFLRLQESRQQWYTFRHLHSLCSRWGGGVGTTLMPWTELSCKEEKPITLGQDPTKEVVRDGRCSNYIWRSCTTHNPTTSPMLLVWSLGSLLQTHTPLHCIRPRSVRFARAFPEGQKELSRKNPTTIASIHSCQEWQEKKEGISMAKTLGGCSSLVVVTIVPFLFVEDKLDVNSHHGSIRLPLSFFLLSPLGLKLAGMCPKILDSQPPTLTYTSHVCVYVLRITTTPSCDPF
jgi:hypothetical protein